MEFKIKCDCGCGASILLGAFDNARELAYIELGKRKGLVVKLSRLKHLVKELERGE